MRTMFMGLAALSFSLVAGCVGADVEDFAAMTDDADDTAEVGSIASPLSAQPSVNDIYIREIRANGSGCPSGTVSSVIGADGQSFVIIFNDMQLAYPPGNFAQTKSCTAVLQLHVPQGLQVSVGTINTSGYASLAQGHRAAQFSTYSFAGQPLAGTFRTPLNGPFEDVYRFTDQVAISSLVWSRCGAQAPFMINTTLSLNTGNNRQGTAVLSNDTIDGEFKKILHIQWRYCRG